MFDWFNREGINSQLVKLRSRKYWCSLFMNSFSETPRQRMQETKEDGPELSLFIPKRDFSSRFFLDWWVIFSYSFSCWEPVWGIPPVTRSWGRKLIYARHAQLQGPLWKFLSMYPNKNLPAFVLCLSTLLTFSGKSQFRALVFCIWKSVSIQKTPPMAF